MALPRVNLTGNMVADAELRSTPAGKALLKFRVACSQRVKDGDTWRDGQVCFIDCVVWEKKAEAFAEVGLKGATVMVTGDLTQRQWETDSGEKRSAFEIRVDEVAVVAKNKSGGQSGGDSWGGGSANVENQDTEPPF